MAWHDATTAGLSALDRGGGSAGDMPDDRVPATGAEDSACLAQLPQAQVGNDQQASLLAEVSREKR